MIETVEIDEPIGLDDYADVVHLAHAVRALRAVLSRAIGALRPSGEQSMVAVEWTLYNILDLKFLQGQRMSDIANRLAVSESDLYRKQRAAIDEVARLLTLMEQQAGRMA